MHDRDVPVGIISYSRVFTHYRLFDCTTILMSCHSELSDYQHAGVDDALKGPYLLLKVAAAAERVEGLCVAISESTRSSSLPGRNVVGLEGSTRVAADTGELSALHAGNISLQKQQSTMTNYVTGCKQDVKL